MTKRNNYLRIKNGRGWNSEKIQDPGLKGAKCSVDFPISAMTLVVGRYLRTPLGSHSGPGLRGQRRAEVALTRGTSDGYNYLALVLRPARHLEGGDHIGARRNTH
jgi:hypothetical protein